MISREILAKRFEGVPKESIEILLRNVRVREILENIWKRYRAGIKLEYDGGFDRIFEEVFRLFFRPLELAISGMKRVRLLLPPPDVAKLYDIQLEMADGYRDLSESLALYLELTMDMLKRYAVPDGVRDLIDAVMSGYIDTLNELSLFGIRDIELGSEVTLAFTSRTFEYLRNFLKNWNEFVNLYYEFRRMMKDTYREAVEEFIRNLEFVEFGGFQEFMYALFDAIATKFDELLRSEEYLDVQARMVGSLMDHFYYYRRFCEEILENNPANPVATVSQIDEAYRRITDLRRKVAELERRVAELERRVSG